MSRGFTNIAAFDKAKVGLQYENISTKYNNHKVSSSIGMFIASGIGMALVAVIIHYVENCLSKIKVSSSDI
jgi:hypothetical protein